MSTATTYVLIDHIVHGKAAEAATVNVTNALDVKANGRNWCIVQAGHDSLRVCNNCAIKSSHPPPNHR